MNSQRPIGRRPPPRPLSRPVKRLPPRPAVRRLPFHPHGRDRPEAADPTFVRLLRDLTLAASARRRIKRGELKSRLLPDTDELERESMKHLANYLAAGAWAAMGDDCDEAY
jgi:hypothetical protein